MFDFDLKKFFRELCKCMIKQSNLTAKQLLKFSPINKIKKKIVMLSQSNYMALFLGTEET